MSTRAKIIVAVLSVLGFAVAILGCGAVLFLWFLSSVQIG